VLAHDEVEHRRLGTMALVRTRLGRRDAGQRRGAAAKRAPAWSGSNSARFKGPRPGGAMASPGAAIRALRCVVTAGGCGPARAPPRRPRRRPRRHRVARRAPSVGATNRPEHRRAVDAVATAGVRRRAAVAGDRELRLVDAQEGEEIMIFALSSSGLCASAPLRFFFFSARRAATT
jgi:hypothetical protein